MAELGIEFTALAEGYAVLKLGKEFLDLIGPSALAEMYVQLNQEADQAGYWANRLDNCKTCSSDDASKLWDVARAKRAEANALLQRAKNK